MKQQKNKPMMVEPRSFELLSLQAGKQPIFKNIKHAVKNSEKGIKVIPIHGILTKNSEAFDDILGMTSYEKIREEIEEALIDEEVETIILDIDSPGGEVNGLFDLSDFIYEARALKKIVAIAVGTGITYEQLTGDLTGVNYSSIRAGLIEFRRRCGMLQHNIMVYQFCRPVWDRWLELAILSGELDIGEKGAKEAKEVKWIAQGFDWVDPLKDQQAQQMAVRNGFKSRSEVVSELGYDIEEIDQEIAEDQRRASSLGLSFDSDVTTNQEII